MHNAAIEAADPSVSVPNGTTRAIRQLMPRVRGPPRWPETADMLMMRPQPWAPMPGRKAPLDQEGAAHVPGGYSRPQ